MVGIWIPICVHACQVERGTVVDALQLEWCRHFFCGFYIWVLYIMNGACRMLTLAEFTEKLTCLTYTTPFIYTPIICKAVKYPR